jgi:ABC-type Zn uptake system ZnuABC Zn-binding protein ZnuA
MQPETDPNSLPNTSRRGQSQRRPLRRLTTALLGVPLVFAACGEAADEAGQDTTEESGQTVVVTTSIWADVVSEVACGDQSVNIQTLIPFGGDPHSFEPSLADRAEMEGAALVVANGLFLEEGLEDTLDAVADSGTPMFRFGDAVDTIAFDGDDHDDHDAEKDHDDHNDEEHSDEEDHDDEHGDEEDHDDDHGDEEDAHAHAHDGDDPHVWFDPARVSDALPALAEQLVSHAGLDEAALDQCVTDYQDELAELDAEIAAMFEGLDADQRILVTNHDALGYLADRYDFDIVGTVIPSSSTLAETNPAQLEELAEIIEETGVPAIFAETQSATDDAEALAERVGDISVVSLQVGTLGDEEDSYTAFMRNNATLITEALGG